MGQAMTTTQFYIYGRRQFTKTGYAKNCAAYTDTNFLEEVNLAEKVFVVTGANAGIGKEMTQFLAKKGAKVFMVCRNQDRAEKAKEDIIEETKNSSVFTIIGDCGLASDVRRVVAEVNAQTSHLDGLICNAGALLNERQVTAEGMEVTLATHLVHGAYLLSKLFFPLLRKSTDPRVIMVSSGGMYNTRFPHWDVAASNAGKYDGNMAYAYAKRGQVLLCERWAQKHRDILFLSAHPGWTGTAAVEKAYGDAASYLEPMRNTWEGAEGICWMASTPKENLQSGEFYLDRTPQPKHIAGPFFSEGSFTKNSDTEIEELMIKLGKVAPA